MPNETYYVIDTKRCKHEGMTKEQIINAIAEATGETPQHIDEGFISTVVETNHSTSIHLWKGTAAEYAALATHDPNTWYIITDDTSIEDMHAEVETMQNAVGDMQSTVDDLADDVIDLSGRVTIAEDDLDDFENAIGASNGIATLDAARRVPVGQMPVTGWQELTIAAADITESGYLIPIQYARAKVMMQLLTTRIYADYTKSLPSSTLYGLKSWEASSGGYTTTRIGIGDVTGDSYGFSIYSVSANSNGITIKKEGSTAQDVKVWIRQDA